MKAFGLGGLLGKPSLDELRFKSLRMGSLQSAVRGCCRRFATETSLPECGSLAFDRGVYRLRSSSNRTFSREEPG